MSPSPSVRNASARDTSNGFAPLAAMSIGASYLASLRRSALTAGKLAALATAATLLLGAFPASAVTQSAEGCPGSTTLAAGFDWTQAGWAPSGSAAGISVWGDAALARWSTAGPAISAVVITAGTTTINYTYDPVSTDGAVAASDVESAAGASLAHLGFCKGPGTLPTSGSKISVGVSKTAVCATLNADQTASVQGTITVIRHRPADSPPSVAIRVRTTRDTVFASDGSNVGETTSIDGLTGVVMQPGTDTLTVPYSVTFTPGADTAYSNKIEITIEESGGLDRHKYYAAWAPFSLCEAGTKLEVVKDLSPASDPGKFNLQIDGSTAGTGANVGDGGTTGEVTVNPGSHTVGEAAVTGTDLANYTSSTSCVDQANESASVAVSNGSVTVTEGSDIVCTIVNTRIEVGQTPRLVIEKAANVETITISGPANARTASPSSVTWTLNYTLTHGPVTHAVITDPLPTGFSFVSASNGGTYDPTTKTITWNLGDLTGSGSVSLVTSVNVATISRSHPVVNIATIASDQTPSDSGQDSVTVTSGGTEAGNPTPTPIVPNTAVAFGPAGQPISVPIELLVALCLGSLGGLAVANVRAVQRRRR